MGTARRRTSVLLCTWERVFHRMEEPPDDQFVTYVLNLDRLRIPNQPKLDS